VIAFAISGRAGGLGSVQALQRLCVQAAANGCCCPYWVWASLCSCKLISLLAVIYLKLIALNLYQEFTTIIWIM